ncbi:hypothetical protein, conserved [Plasmodium ovale]|uniref:PIR protein n=1 Tax=Plasmodium ovale TaxID=36330 RepID=A0A1C3KJT6_PLAOA|nr:hypothetical protein, conserved [Plasmodium ovale]
MCAKITKEQIFPKFDNPDFTNDQETLQFLNYLEKNDQELYEIGCSFEKAHKFAHFSYTNGKPNYMCPFFNEWLNEKKKNYTSNGENCNKVQLWTEYIEKLWIQLVENEDNKNWCPRETDMYKCSKSTPHVTAILLSTVKHRFHSFLNKNERIGNNIYKYGSSKLLQYSENADTFMLNDFVNLQYHSSHN